MDLTRAAGAPVTREVDGKTYTFRKLKLSEVAALCARWRARDRDQLKARCVDAGLDADATFARLDEFDREHMHVSRYMGRTMSADGALEVIGEVLPDGEDIDDLPFDSADLAALAWEVVGMPPLSSVASRQNGKPPAEPKSETGSSTPE